MSIHTIFGALSQGGFHCIIKASICASVCAWIDGWIFNTYCKKRITFPAWLDQIISDWYIFI